MPSKELILHKAHDHCASTHPQLTVIFVHGIAADSSSFANALKYLEDIESLRNVRFVAFDLLGSGGSSKSDELEYNYAEQLEALNNAINELQITTPLILVGHSMGTLIATRYADKHRKSVKQLIWISPPVYTERDLDNPAFAAAMKLFQDAVSVKNRKIVEEKSFKNSIKHIVTNRQNYKILSELTTPATLIYGEADQIIAPHNIPKILKANPKYLTAIKTAGRHGVSREKYSKMAKLLEEALDDETI